MEPLVGWIFASNPVLVLFKFPKESRREHTRCSVFQRFLMTGARGPGFHCEPPGAALGAGLSERHPAGGASWEPGRDAWEPGLGVWGPVSPASRSMTEDRVSRSAPSEHAGASSAGQASGSISESSRL